MAKNSLPARSEMDPAYCWDLTPIYKDVDAWEKDFKKLDQLLEKIQTFKGHLADSAETLRDAFKAEDKMAVIIDRLYHYAGHNHDADVTDPVYTALHDRISARDAEISGDTAWFTPELQAIPKKKMEAYLKSPVLAFYKRSLDEVARFRPHVLSEAEERILGLSADALSTPGNIFKMLNDADLVFPEIQGAKGKKVQVTHGNYSALQESSDRRVRKDSFSAVYDTYKGVAKTFAAILDGTVKAEVLSAKLRNYGSAREMALFNDNIPLSVYDNLIDTVHAYLPALHRYFKLRAKIMGLKKLDMYDIRNPLVPGNDKAVPYEQAVKMVKHAMLPMGKEYCKILDHAFTDRWIDVFECRGKRSGAYSGGFFRTPPVVLLNYSGTLDSVFTLAHELGHSMHSYFSDHAQEYRYSSYRIFAAEVASTTNELLLYHDLMKQVQTKEEKASLINFLLDTIRGTAFRQTMFAEFERDIYGWSESGTPLTEDALSNRYFGLNKLYHGPAVKADPRIRYEWARIPHFHYNFYVYKYATGISAAAALSQDILNGKTDRYLNFLKSGDSKDVIDILKDAGVDFTTPAPVEACMKLFDENVKALEKLLKA